MPNEKVEYNFFVLPMIENYYECKEKESQRYYCNHHRNPGRKIELLQSIRSKERC